MKIVYSSQINAAHWPWSKMNLVEVAELAQKNKIYMAKLGFHHLNNIDSWDGELGDAANSKKLWINSLVSAHACLEASKRESRFDFYESGVRLLKSYLSQYDSNDGLFDVAWRDEHSVANRLFVLTAFLVDSTQKSDDAISQIELLRHAERHAEWLYEDNNYVVNNHGVMMDLSLLQFSIFIMTIAPETSERYQNTSLRRLNKMLDVTFLPDGYCTENSPTYHYVNYSLFKSVNSFLDKYNIIYNKTHWKNVLQRAHATGLMLTRVNGTIPLIGDSARHPNQFYEQNKDDRKAGVAIFPNSGLFIFSGNEIHATMRAGGKSFTHRHIDDLSITLWLKNKEIFCDGGLYNYDIADRKRRHFISWRAHSGTYLETDKKIGFKDFESPASMSHFKNFKVSNGSCKVTGVQKLVKGSQVARELKLTDSQIILNDEVSSIEEEKWLTQFILSPNVEARVDSESLSCKLVTQNRHITIYFESIGLRDVRIKLSDVEISTSFQKTTSTKKLFLEGTGRNGQVITKLDFGEKLDSKLLHALQDNELNITSLEESIIVQPNTLKNKSVTKAGEVLPESWVNSPERVSLLEKAHNFIGLSVVDDLIYAKGVGPNGSKTLFVTDSNSLNFNKVCQFEEGILHFMSTPFGYFCQTKTHILKSTDRVNWTKVFKLPTTTFLLNGWDFDPINQVIAFGEYHTKPNVEVKIYVGFNGGEKWKVVKQFKPNEVRHIHAIQYDRYSESFWIGTGDTDSQSRIYRTDDLFRTLNEVASGSQDYRVTSFGFTKDRVIWGSDAPRVPQKIMYIARSDYSDINTLKVCQDKPFYFSHSNGEHVYLCSLSESIKELEIDQMNRVFRIDGNSVEEVISMEIKEVGKWARLYPFGEDSNGCIYFSAVYMKSGATNTVFKYRLNN